jgi:hypothetical protein
LGFSCPNFKGEMGRNELYLQRSKNEITVINKFKASRRAINAFKAIMKFKAMDFYGSNALWNYMVVNASLRSYIIHQDQSGLSCPNHKGKRGRK